MPLAASLLLLLACPTPDGGPPIEPASPPPAGCTELPEPPALAACAAPVGGWPAGEEPGFGGSFQLSVTGRASEAGEGEVPDACFDNDYMGTLDEEATPWWFRGEDSTGGTWTIGVVGIPRAVLEGDTLAASFTWAGEFQWQNEEGVLVVRDGGGELLAWIVEGGTLAGPSAPADFTLAEGEPVCSTRASTGECPAWVAFDVDVDAVPVPWGTVGTAGAWRVVHAGYERAWDTEVEGCAWYADPVRWLLGASPL